MNPFSRRCTEAALAACLGILAGLSISWVRPRGSAPKEQPPEPGPPTEPTVAYERGGEAIAAPRPTDIVPRVPVAAPASPEPAPRVGPVPAARQMDLEEELREADRFHEQQNEAALRRHRDEPRDPRWASATESKLQLELESVAAGAKFKVVRVDCRTTTCVSVLEWRSYPEALRGYGATLRRAYAVNCAQQVLLLPPPNPAAAYQASMIFDCESWRAAGN